MLHVSFYISKKYYTLNISAENMTSWCILFRYHQVTLFLRYWIWDRGRWEIWTYYTNFTDYKNIRCKLKTLLKEIFYEFFPRDYFKYINVEVILRKFREIASQMRRAHLVIFAYHKISTENYARQKFFALTFLFQLLPNFTSRKIVLYDKYIT